MSKKRTKEKRRMPETAEPSSGKPSPAGGGNPIGEFFASKGVRETIESVAIAFVLAFLFRTFEAEAFVIPTGSMAHTLMGMHKDVECDKCGYRHTAGASESHVDQKGAVVGTVCPMCQHVNVLSPDGWNYSGDRILVSKFIYDMQEPDRWDVVVFKFPMNAKQNYIKRLVGLPNETVRIQHGNLWTRKLGSDDPFRIARKPPAKIRAMLQNVHDTYHIPAELGNPDTWPPRWEQKAAGEDGWNRIDAKVADGGRDLVRPTFKIGESSPGGNPQWLRYRHYAPRTYFPNALRQRPPDDWQSLQRGEQPAVEPTAQLISDFYSYNASLHMTRGTNPLNVQADAQSVGMHWVGDLAVQANVKIESSQGTVYLDLVQAGRHYRCAIDVATGEAVLSILDIDGAAHNFGDDEGGPAQVKGKTSVVGPGKYDLMLANVDHQLTLWVNGKVISFDGSTTYSTDAVAPDWSDADEGDLAPVGIGSDGAAVEVTRLRVMRDIYYIAQSYPSNTSVLNDYDIQVYFDGEDYDDGVREVRSVLINPRQSRAQMEDWLSRRGHVDFDLEEDKFFTLGDNSPESQDARIWGVATYGDPRLKGWGVHRDFLIGKAMFIYWPHATGPVAIPGFGPITPNVARMRLVR